MTPEQYTKEFGQNPVAFAEKYQGRFINIRGEVTGHGYTQFGKGYLQLGKEPWQFACQEQRPAAKAMPGQTVSLRAKPEPLEMTWQIIKVTGNGPPELTAEQLRKDLDSDRAGTNAKYAGKLVVLSGRVVYVGVAGDIALEAPKQAINCYFHGGSAAENERNSSFKKGQKVRVFGKFEVGDQSLSNCELVDVMP